MARRYSFRAPLVLSSVLTLFSIVGVWPAWAQFEARSTRTIPSESLAIAAGDFNNDGKLDLAVQNGKGLSIALGNGDGTFQAPTTYPYVIGASLAVGDFNGDGNLDLVAPYGDGVAVFLGNGDGTFQAPITSPTTGPAYSVVVGDFNGDHKLDIAIVDAPYISVLLGNGDGTFQAPINNESFVGPQYLAVGDFNNNHNLGVAVVGYFGGEDDLGILLGNGDGTLQSSITYTLSYTPDNVAVGDFNHDGNLDVVVGDLVTVFLGKETEPSSREPSISGPKGTLSSATSMATAFWTLRRRNIHSAWGYFMEKATVLSIPLSCSLLGRTGCLRWWAISTTIINPTSYSLASTSARTLF